MLNNKRYIICASHIIVHFINLFYLWAIYALSYKQNKLESGECFIYNDFNADLFSNKYSEIKVYISCFIFKLFFHAHWILQNLCRECIYFKHFQWIKWWVHKKSHLATGSVVQFFTLFILYIYRILRYPSRYSLLLITIVYIGRLSYTLGIVFKSAYKLVCIKIVFFK